MSLREKIYKLIMKLSFKGKHCPSRCPYKLGLFVLPHDDPSLNKYKCVKYHQELKNDGARQWKVKGCTLQ